MYEFIFSKEAVKKIHSFNNPNSGNIVEIFNVNTTLRMEKEFGLGFSEEV